MRDEKTANRAVTVENAKLKKEVTNLSRALTEVKKGRSFYMVTMSLSKSKDGVYNQTNAQQFYCRKKDAIRFMEAQLAQIEAASSMGQGRKVSETEAIYTGTDVYFQCKVDKINPI